jgi:RNAse (barnase) inhibitor barstar
VDNVADSFVIFTERGLLGLAHQGRMGLIVPSGWLTARMYRSLREWLHSVCAIEYIVHLPYDVFPDAYIDTIIFISQKSSSVSNRVLIRRYGIRESAEELASKTQHYDEVDPAIWQEDPHHRFLTLLSPLVISIHNKVRQFGIKAETFLEVARGMTPFSGATEGSQTARTGFWGTVGRYDLRPERIGQVSTAGLTECPTDDFFVGERLIIRRIISRQHRIHATHVDTDFAINKSYLLAISKDPSISLFYLLALINARLFSQIFIWFSEVAKRDDFPQLDMATVREFPIRRINFTTPADERYRQLEKAKTLYQFCLNKGETDCVLGFVKDHLTADPERSDVVHDLLAFLAEQMVEMNKAKGEEVRGFLRYLEREIGVEIDTLKNKTAIQSYFGLSLDGLLDILKKNRRSIPINLSDRNFQESLEREFTNSLATLNPLLTRIQQTDALIDQVVYQLYGLTDEEIVVVEGEV